MKFISHRIDVTERHLLTWIEDLFQQHNPLSLALFQKKARTEKEAKKEEDAADVKSLVHQGASFSIFRSGMASKV